MSNISKESKNVLKIIEHYGPIRSSDIVSTLSVSIKTVYKHLTILLGEDLIEKSGTTPKVFYFIKKEHLFNSKLILSINEQIIEQNYIYVSPSGELVRGLNGFYQWCHKNELAPKKEESLFIKSFKSIQKFKKNGLISVKKSILSGKADLYLDDIFFSDFYTFDHFGKTKLGQLVYLGKTSQNKELISEIAKIIKNPLENIIEKHNIKLVCFIPPTIERKIQFLDVLKNKLKLNLEEVIAMKISSSIRIPQKTLRKLEDRIINAQKTITISPSQKIDTNILIIDDATGSGATLNETAKKIRKITKHKIKIFGYSVVGSYKGFDVISEV